MLSSIRADLAVNLNPYSKDWGGDDFRIFSSFFKSLGEFKY